MLIAATAMVVAFAGVLVLFLILTRARDAEQRYRTLLENLPQSAVTLFDDQLRLRLAAGGSLREGVAAAEHLGRSLTEIVPGEQGELLAGHYRAALAGESRSIEYTSALDGRDYWLRVVPVREGERIVGGLAVSQDITDRKSAERDREQAEDRRQLMVDAMNDAYVAADADGLVTDWNKRATELFGYEREEAIGRSCKELIIPPEDHADYDRLIEYYLRGERPERRLDLRMPRTAVHKDGTRFTVELAAATLEDRGTVSLHTFMHDITDRVRNAAETEARAAEVEALAEATGALARSTEPDDARHAICEAAGKIANAEVAILFEPDPSGRGLAVAAAIGAEVGGDVLPFVGTASGAVRAFTSLEPLFIPDLVEHPAVNQAMVERTGARSALWVPVRRDSTALGVITVAWQRQIAELPDRTRQMMGLVGAEAAVAIERAELLGRLTMMARTDDLTGLPNRRAWDEELGRELARARREGSPLTIAMIDLDHFKDYNDDHGHQAGDRLLKQAGAAWRGALRETDLLARYGGEEFAIALPGCDLDASLQLVERLRAVTPAYQSCSAGVVAWDGFESEANLVGRADRALYAAKQAGRDRAVIG